MAFDDVTWTDPFVVASACLAASSLMLQLAQIADFETGDAAP